MDNFESKRKLRRSKKATMYDQINVTPLVDTLFFLLIIFMLTAPLLENAVNISPPVMSASKIDPDSHAKTISITEDGTITMDRKTLTEDSLSAELHALRQSDPNATVFIRGDKEVRYGVVMDVMKAVKQAQFDKVLLVTEEEKR